MKKIGIYFSIIVISVAIFLLGFNYDTSRQPHSYYNVYLDDELIGMIKSQKELEEYINSKADKIRENLTDYSSKIPAINTFNKYLSNFNSDNMTKEEIARTLMASKSDYNLTDLEIDEIKKYLDEKLYDYSFEEIEEMKNYVSQNEIYSYTKDVYTPNGIEIKKVYTYHDNLISVPEIYKEIISKKSCTIAGYKFTIKSTVDGVDDINIYTTDTKIFSDAVENLITIFVDEDTYEKYKQDKQSEIESTGSIITNIYVNQKITYKAVNIPIDEKIYTDSTDLSAYLLYGDKFEEKKVIIQFGDSIESVSFNNQISVEEFLIFNKQYNSRENLLVPGSSVTISTVDPKLQIVVETHEVVDKETNYNTVEEYAPTISQGSTVVMQEGENGLERVTQNVKSINGEITYVAPVSKETIKESASKIIAIGTKYVPSVGSTATWGWPTDSGYTLSSYYGYRLQVFGEGNFHSGLDIAGTGYGSNIYASNNGVIIKIGYESSYGYHIILDHNNGYYSTYGHMSGFAPGLSLGSTVERGQVIGYVGSSGWATGPHLHFEIRVCEKYSCTVNPLPYLRR